MNFGSHSHRAYWTDERRLRASEYHRRRHGAPPGHCTIWGIHVPVEHREPIRFWADRYAHRYGQAETAALLAEIKAANWQIVPRLLELMEQSRLVAENRETITQISWEAYRANKNSG